MPAAVDQAATARLCDRVRAELELGDGGVVRCDVAAVEPALPAVDALARMQLDARRLGGSIVLVHACRQLRELLDLVGLAGVIPVDDRR